MRLQIPALLFLLANAAALVIYLVGIGLPIWWWGIVAAVLGSLVIAAQWRRCVPSSLRWSRSRSQAPPTRR